MGASAMEVEPQELCSAEVSFLVALTKMAEQGKEGLNNEIACVSSGLGSAEMSDKDELGCVGAGLGGGFDHRAELHVMKFKQAMKTVDKEHWQRAVGEEHARMQKHKVWEAVKREEVPADVKVLTSTWAMKKKSNGKFRARINARGYKQVDGIHYDADTMAAPVWTAIGLTLWISWVDDCVSVGKKELVLSAKKGMTNRFNCDEVGELTEFVGCKLDRSDGVLRITQPVLMQSFVDEFELPEGPAPVTPAEPGSVLMKAREDEAVDTIGVSVGSRKAHSYDEMVAVGRVECGA